MKVYIAGPMRGYPQFNFPAFDACRDYLLSIGWEPISPADMDRTEKGFDPTTPDFDPDAEYDFDVADALRRDFEAISHCEGIVFLPGWEGSKGANAERMLGQALDLQPIVYHPDAHFDQRLGYTGWQILEDRFMHDRYGNLDTGEDIPDDVKETILEALKEGDIALQTREYRVTDPTTGGQKNQKEVQLSMLPWPWLEDLGRVYAMGAQKYDRHNWRKGYAWSLSIDAAFRHFIAWLQGESVDPESGVSHLAHLAWHTATLHTFEREYLGTDDR